MHISKRDIPEEFKSTMSSVLFSVLGKRSTQNDFCQVMNSLFSPVEQTMILKRVTIWFLIAKHIDYETIAHALRTSIGTVSRYAAIYSLDSYVQSVIKFYVTNEKFVDTLRAIFDGLFVAPGRYGVNWSDAWRRIFERERKQAIGI